MRYLILFLFVGVVTTPVHEVTIGRVGKSKVNLTTVTTGSPHQVTTGRIGGEKVLLITTPDGVTTGRIGNKRVFTQEVK